MSFWGKLDPTNDHFLGLNPAFARQMGDMMTGALAEYHRKDPFWTQQGTGINKIGRSVGGAGPGAVGGFVTGGPYGAVAGGIGGGILAGTGKTDNTTLSGFGENLGVGVGAGSLAGYGLGSGLWSGGGYGAGAGAGAGGVPTAGVNGVTTASGATGLGQGVGAPAASTPGWMRALQMARSDGNQQQDVPQGNYHAIIENIYKMLPNLKPRYGWRYYG